MSTTRVRRSKAAKQELKQKCFNLHAQRKSCREIGAELGISHEWARQLVLEAYRENLAPVVQHERQKDLDLIDQLVDVAVSKYLATHDPKDYDAVHKMLDRRAKILGYDQQVEKIEHSGNVSTPFDTAMSSLLSQMDEIDAAQVEMS